VGVLCASCAELLPVCEGLIPEHVSSRVDVATAAGWLIDGFGAAHPLAATRTTVGRRPQADLVLLNGSVSRDHAEVHHTDTGWVLRDLGSRNGTVLDGERVQGRAPLGERSILRFGDIALLFIGHRVVLPEPAPKSIATVHAAGAGPQRYTLRGATVDLCLIGGADEDAGGALRYRSAGTSAWSELSLPPLEFQLLRALCARAVAEVSSPSRSRGCVPTKQLAKTLPFQSRYANEENVRQVVRRIRGTLQQIGAAELVEALPGRGYYVAWPVVTT
jgi:predicted component of type VI protein secretion system